MNQDALQVEVSGATPGGALPLLVYVTGGREDDGLWFSRHYPGVRWKAFNQPRQTWLERRIPKPNLTLVRSCWRASRYAIREDARLLISVDPKVTYRCGEVLRFSTKHVPHLAWSFNFAELPRGMKRKMMAHAFEQVDCFIVHSTMERSLYADVFKIPIDRFEMMRWAVGSPEVNHPDRPIVPGDYLCALGGNARDYGTLMDAMALLPEIPLVAILRPHNLEGITVPPNVTVKMGIPTGDANNILMHSRFMALPLVGTEIPCGHVTVVAAMHLGKAQIVTRSTGLDDYVMEDRNALTYEARSAEDLASKIRKLWDDPGLCQTLGENGRRFAAEYCSNDLARNTLTSKLRQYGMLPAEG
jgi:hypothetical protein